MTAMAISLIFLFVFIVVPALLILEDGRVRRPKKVNRSARITKELKTEIKCQQDMIGILTEDNVKLQKENAELKAFKENLELVTNWTYKSPEELHEEALMSVRKEFAKELHAEKE